MKALELCRHGMLRSDRARGPTGTHAAGVKALASKPASPSDQQPPDRGGTVRSYQDLLLRTASSASSGPSEATIGGVQTAGVRGGQVVIDRAEMAAIAPPPAGALIPLDRPELAVASPADAGLRRPSQAGHPTRTEKEQHARAARPAAPL